MVNCMFYLEKRDGIARIGKLKYKNIVFETPYLINYLDEPSIARELDFGRAATATKYVIPEYLYEDLKSKSDEINLVTGLSTLSPHQVVDIFNQIERNKPIYAVGVADPLNLPILIYMGVDIVDNILAIKKAYDGIYFLGELELDVGELEKLPCSCKYCRNSSTKDFTENELFEVVARHNTEMLLLEIEKCKRLIEREELRNYVESKIKFQPILTSTLRLLDKGECSYFQRFKKSKCIFSAIESFSRFEVKYFLRRTLEVYEPKTRLLLILPCTAKKPYLTSRTHRIIRSRVWINVNEIIVSSPLVVPREFELLYPAINYDTPVTGDWTEEEIRFVSKWLRKFVEKGDFEKVVAHVSGGYRKVIEFGLRDYEVVFTCEDGILSDSSLNKLKKEIEGYERYDLYEEMFKHMSRYQFGIEFEGQVRGKYPNLDLFNGGRVARSDLRYGMLDVYEIAARELLSNRLYWVQIGEFEPKNKIFASGVINADEKIRPNDLVIFYSSTIMGVGLAVMSGKEMVESEKGVAVRVKRKWPV